MYGREVFPIAVRRQPDAVIYETDDEPHVYALVFLTWAGENAGQKRRGNPKTELLADYSAIQARIDRNHAEWLVQFNQS